MSPGFKMSSEPIIAHIDIGEAHRPRARRLADAIASDGHFIRGKVANLSHDIRFQWRDRTINVELKDFSSDEQSDYVASVINSDGRLYHQVLLAREYADPFIIGPKMAAVIQEALGLPGEMMACPKPPKASRARRRKEQNP